MKKLVLVAFVAAVASQAAGCIISSDDTGDDVGDDTGTAPQITAHIELLNGGPSPSIECSSEDGLRVNARRVGTQSGSSDVYPCDTTDLVTPPLTEGEGAYEVWVDLIADRGSDDPADWVVVETTDSVTVNLVNVDLDVDATLVVEHGFFQAHWTIEGSETCEAGESVSIVATVAGTSEATDDIYPCDFGVDGGVAFTDPLFIDDYVLDITLLDGGDNVIGEAPATNASIIDGNEYVDLEIDLALI